MDRIYVVVRCTRKVVDMRDITDVIKVFGSELKAINFVKERFGDTYSRLLYDTWYFNGDPNGDYITIDEWEVE